MLTKDAFLARFGQWRTDSEAEARSVLAGLDLAPGVVVVAVKLRGRYALLLRPAAEITARVMPDLEILPESPAAPGDEGLSGASPLHLVVKALFDQVPPTPDLLREMMTFMQQHRHFMTPDLAVARAERDAVGLVGGQPVAVVEALGYYTLMPVAAAAAAVQVMPGTMRIVPDTEVAAPRAAGQPPPPIERPGATLYPLSVDFPLGTEIPVPPAPPAGDAGRAIFHDELYPQLVELAKRCKAAGLPFVFAVQIGGMDDQDTQEMCGVLSLHLDWQSRRMDILQMLADGRMPVPAMILREQAPDAPPQSA